LENHRRVKTKWFDTAGSLLPFAFLIYLLIGGCLLALSAVVPFNGSPIDGPFQIFDPLRRIAAGQIPGVDFQFYHGILIPFIHYPVFALLGKTIFASEISRQIVSIFAFVGSLYLVFFAYTRKLQAAATLSALAILLIYTARAYPLMFPSGSLTGLRSTMPLIFFAVLLVDLPAIHAAAALGVVAALAITTSTENGLAVTLAFMISALIFALRHKQLTLSWRLAAVFIASLAAGLVIVLGLLSHFRGIRSILKYNFIDVPKDQYWLFGSAPASAPASLADLFVDPWFWVPLAVTFVLFLATLLATLLLPARSMTQLPPTGLAMTLYALATFTPYLSRYNPEYAQPAIRICSIYFLLLFAHYAAPSLARFRPAKLAFHAVAAVLIICFVTYRASTFDIASLRARITELNSAHWKPSLYPDWQTYLTQAEALMPDAARKTIWSEYSGLLHDHFGKFNPSTDYIIHVLGPEPREEYLRQFRQLKPDYVETLPVGGVFVWSEWLHNTFWDFYQELLLNYTRKGVTGHSAIWERKSPVSAALRSAGIVAQGHLKGPLSIPLPADLHDDQLLIVQLEYEIHNPWQWLPMIGHSPRFVVHWDGVSGPIWTPSVALPEYRSSVRFPLVPHRGENPRLRFSVDSVLPGASIDVRQVSLSLLSLSPEDFDEFAGPQAAAAASGDLRLRTHPLTDSNWSNGVWINLWLRNQAGFFLLATPESSQLLAHAKALLFNQSGRRKILLIEPNGPWLNVFVDGPPLSPSGDGYPHRITAE
jgi:hypothetical protein